MTTPTKPVSGEGVTFAAFVGAVLLIPYFVGAFVLWDFNAGHWPQEVRVVVAACGVAFVSAFVAGYVSAFE